jgi:hypothetical protein
MMMSPARLEHENDCAGEDQQQNDRSILSSEKLLHKDYNSKYSVEKEIAGRGSQGACRQDELISG